MTKEDHGKIYELLTLMHSDMKSMDTDIKALGTKFSNIDKIVAVHEQKLIDQKKSIDGIETKAWQIGSAAVLALIGTTFELFKK